MLYRKIYFVVFILLFTVLSACQSDKNMTSGTTRVVIISTNDIHAQIDHFPKFATFLKQIRAENPHVLLVDGGDRFSGNVYVDNAKEKGKPMFDLMGKLGYNVATFGNHEFDYGEAELNKRISESSFPVICANIQTKGTPLEQPDPYRILEVAGIRFCFLGLLETNAVTRIPATNPDNVKGITFRYHKAVALEHKKLKNQCDVFIGLTHIGFTADSLLAVAMPELDVIIGGHSHTLIEDPRVINNVLVSQTGSNLRYAGVTYLDFKGKKLINKTYKAVKLDDFGEDADMEAMVREISNHPEFKEKIGITSKGLKYKENVANLVTDAMSEAAGCDFAFYNSGGVRYNSIPAGDITRETIYRIEPFNNYIVRQRLTLNEIKELILNRFNGLKNRENRRIDLFISRGRYTILKDENGDGVDVVFVDKNGNKLKDPQQEFTIGLSNYVNSAYDFAGKGKGENTHIYIVEAIEKFVKTRGDVNYQERRTFINKK